MLKNGIVILCVMLGFMTKIAHAEIKTISELLSAGYELKTAIKGGFFRSTRYFFKREVPCMFAKWSQCLLMLSKIVRQLLIINLKNRIKGQC